jgi:hypothetical protein
VTDLAPAELGTFDFFFDVGCFQGLTCEQRLGEGRSVSALAAPGATLLMLAFGPTGGRRVGRRGEGGRRGCIPGLGDPFGRARGDRGAGLAADEDSAAVVPAAPTGLVGRQA